MDLDLAELRDFIENVAVPVHWVGQDGVILWANEAELALLGYARAEYVGRHIADFHVDRPVIDDILQRLRHREVVHNREARVRHKDGSVRHVLVNSSALWRDGQFVHSRCVSVDITDRKQFDEVRARLAAIIDSSDDAIVSKTLEDGVIRSWNRAAERIFGYTAGEAIGRHISLIVPAHRRTELDEVMTRLRRGEKIDHFETERQTKDGRLLNVSLTVSPIHDASGRIVGASKVARDVTEQLRVRAALEESQRRFRLVADSAPVLIWVNDAAGGCEFVNQAYLDFYGVTLAEVQGAGWTGRIHPDDIDGYLSAYKDAFDRRVPFRAELRLLRADGQYRWLESYALPRYTESGEFFGYVGVSPDVTERKEAEALVHVRAHRAQSQGNVARLLNRVGGDLASSLHRESIVQRFTDVATELTGAQFGAFFYNVTDPQTGSAYLLHALSGVPKEMFAGFAQPRATGLFGVTFRGEGTIRLDDVTTDPRFGRNPPYNGMPPGHLPVRSYLAVPVTTRSGEALGGLFLGHPTVGVFTEEHEQIVEGVAEWASMALENARLYAQAEEAVQAREDFLSVASHELRTPLNAIVGWAQILKNGARNTAELQKGLDTIERNARVQAQLIDDLLDMSRITSGKLRLDIQQVRPTSFIEAAVETVRPAADAKGVRLETVLDPFAGPVPGDPGRLQQVIWNLLSNAIKFTPRGGKVQIVLGRVNSQVEMSVADTGCGIAPDLLPHMFERFRQAEAVTTRVHGGLGLGLSIVKSLVELHGGTVRIASPGEGQGTTVTVLLPLAVVRHSDAADRLHPTAPPPMAPRFVTAELTGLTVLVVDDQADARDLIRRVLEECGATALTAANADEALAHFHASAPQVLITDIGMPDVDGFQLLRRVRALGPKGLIPAVALTAFARSEDRTRALRAGFAVHVAKPVDASELVATVASVAGRIEGQV